jgi:hypothetical protein
MPRLTKLKVYRTPIGFHDAYVAAPSQKAAMEAWGSDKDLFSRGEAELVTDAALSAEPLAKPGVVIKRLRGTVEEQLAALPPDRPRTARSDSGKASDDGAEGSRAPKPSKKKPPRPSRATLDEAEEALTEAEERHAAIRKDLIKREKALAEERRAAEAAHAAETERLERARQQAAKAFQAQLDKWERIKQPS